MIKLIKKTIHKILLIYGYELNYIRTNLVDGKNLDRDLNIIIDSTSPVCFDVGANEGQSIQYFSKIFLEPLIYSFEPSTKVFNRLMAQYSECNKVELFNVALGEEKGEKVFINYKASVLSSFLALDASKENRFRGYEVDDKEVVKIDTIDSVVETKGVERIDLLKIDTQGYDLNVLKGAEVSLRTGVVKSIFIEVNFISMYKNQSNPLEIIEYLMGHNYYFVGFYEKVYQENTMAWATALFSQRGKEYSQ